MSSKQNPFVWYDVMTTDTTAAEAFYSKVVGWDIKDSGMPDRYYGVLSAGGAMVGGLMPIPEDARAMGAQPAWMGYIGVDDVDDYAERVKAAGGAILRDCADIPGVGRFAVAADPHGAGFILFKPNTDQAPAPAPMGAPGHVGWRELHAGDGPSAFDFYSGLFGWTKEEAIDMGAMGIYQTFKTAGEQGGGIMTKMPQSPRPFWLYYFNVDAIDAASTRVKDAGGQIINGPMQVPGERWIVQGLDPQGAMFALLAGKR
jgi:predicted enzyme related to lactoylglutathione lyase